MLALVVVFVIWPLAVLAVFSVVPLPLSSVMVVRLAEGEGLDRRWRPLSEMPGHVPAAVLASEDNLFCEHHGFDWEAVSDAIEDAQAGKPLRGASTLSMQTAKNVFLWPHRSFIRKGLEAYLTSLVELVWSKRRIVEVYLNIAEWGHGIYGIEAAAQRHFGVPASRLTRWQAALLAAVLPNPLGRDPARPSDQVASRARTILTRIGQLGPLLDCAKP